MSKLFDELRAELNLIVDPSGYGPAYERNSIKAAVQFLCRKIEELQDECAATQVLVQTYCANPQAMCDHSFEAVETEGGTIARCVTCGYRP